MKIVIEHPGGRYRDPIAYTVVGGETLKDIARNVLGDASLWWRMAEANSLAVSGEGALTVGQTLTVPKLSPNANSVGTFQPHHPSQATASMDPVLLTPANGGLWRQPTSCTQIRGIRPLIPRLALYGTLRESR